MDMNYLQGIEEAYKQFELFKVHSFVKQDSYLLLLRNAQEDYDISELVINKDSLAYDTFDRWCENATFFKSSNSKGRYIVIMIYKHNDIYRVVNYYII